MVRSRRMPRVERSSASPALAFFLTVAIGASGIAAFMFFGKSDSPAPRDPVSSPGAQKPKPDSRSPESREGASERAAPAAPEPIAAPKREEDVLSDEALRRSAEKLGRDRLAEKLSPAHIEAMGEDRCRELRDALVEEAFGELKLARRACFWGKTHGKSPASQQRVFVRIVEAAHAMHDTGGFSDEVISGMYGQEEARERVLK